MSQALETLAAVGLAEVAERPVGHLSRGQPERVAIAQAVTPGPRVLLVDKPTARLDRANALAVASLSSGAWREAGERP